MPVPERDGRWFVQILADGVITDDLRQAGNVLDATLIHGDPDLYLLTLEAEHD